MFATLDPTSRRLRLPREREVVINDTVGFIRDLPQDLLMAFRATLEEIEDSDLIVHLVDGSHPGREAQIRAVEKILRDLEYDGIPTLVVFNKVDLLQPLDRDDLLAAHPRALAISALTRQGLEPLLAAVDRALPAAREQPTFHLPGAAVPEPLPDGC
jgi:GTP-binding protein HflX